MLHGHELGEHAGGERPGVHHLRAVRVDDADRLAALEVGGLAAAGGNGCSLASRGTRSCVTERSWPPIGP